MKKYISVIMSMLVVIGFGISSALAIDLNNLDQKVVNERYNQDVSIGKIDGQSNITIIADGNI